MFTEGIGVHAPSPPTMPDPKSTDAQKLAQIKRLAQAHNTPAVNICCHRLAQLILEAINGNAESKDNDQQ